MRGDSVRYLPWLYAMSFAGLGALIPYLALELRAHGVQGWTLGVALAMLPVGRLIAGPAWSVLADRTQAAGRVLRVGSVIAVVGAAFLAFAPSGVPGWIIGAMALLAIGRAPSGPLLDSIALSCVGPHGQGIYGRLRRWGSVGFMLAALVVGMLYEAYGVSPLVATLVASAAFALCTITMPVSDTIARVAVLPALARLWRDSQVRGVLLASALHFTGHVGSTSFLAVHLDRLGYPPSWTGVALAAGVALEVALMSRAREILAVIGVRTLFVAALALAVPRWVCMAVMVSGWGLVGLQGLHGITFGMFWIAGVAWMSERAPREIRTSAQGLLAASVGGVGSLLGMVGASWIVTVWSTSVMYWASAGVAAAATMVALVTLRPWR